MITKNTLLSANRVFGITDMVPTTSHIPKVLLQGYRSSL